MDFYACGCADAHPMFSNPLDEHATDLFVSPAALDTRRLGAAITLEKNENPQALRRLGGSALGTVLKTPDGRRMVDDAATAHGVPGVLHGLQTLAQIRKTGQ